MGVDQTIHGSGVTSESTSSFFNDLSITDDIIDKLAGSQILLCQEPGGSHNIACQILVSRGLQVELVDSLQQINQRLNAQHLAPIDLVLIDVETDLAASVDWINCIRQYQAEIPIIALVGVKMIKQHRLLIKAGINGRLNKPLDSIQLFKILARHLMSDEKINQLKLAAEEKLKVCQNTRLDGINVEVGIKHSDGCNALFFSQLKAFPYNAKVQLDLLSEAIEQRELTLALEATEGLKGCALIICAHALLEAIGQLEMTFCQYGIDNSIHAWLKVQQAYQQVIGSIGQLESIDISMADDLFGAYNTRLKQQTVQTDVKLQNLFAQLKQQLQKQELSALDVLEQICNVYQSQQVPATLIAASSCLESGDFEGAQAMLEACPIYAKSGVN